MATAYLLQSTSSPLKWKQTFTSRPKFLFKSSKLSGNSIPKSTMKCFFSERKQSTNSISNPRLSITSRSRDEKTSITNSIDAMMVLIKKMLNLLKKPAIAAVLLGILLTWYPNSAFAASGGCMGGSDFSCDASCSSFDSSSDDYFYDDSSYQDLKSQLVLFCIVAALVFVAQLLSHILLKTTSVLKLQVGVSGTVPSLQRDLNRIAEVADTSSRSGFLYVLKETIQALLRDHDYCLSGYSSAENQTSIIHLRRKNLTVVNEVSRNNAVSCLKVVETNVKINAENGEKLFNQLSMEERGKFDEETLVNVNNVKRKSSETQESSGIRSEYIVVTILVVAKGIRKLPTIHKRGDLKDALQQLAAIAISSDETKAVQVLWTPQKENDTLSEKELREDYPLLKLLL